MRKKWFWLPVLCLLIGLGILLAACGTATETEEPQSPISTPVGDSPPVSDKATAVPVIPDEAKEMAGLVQQDLAEQLNISEDKIQVVRVTEMEWPDSSLGCPKPGMAYLDVITPGYEIVLKAADQEYTYHTGPDSFVLCQDGFDDEEGDEVVPQPGTEELVKAAKEDLSKRLGIAQEEITLQAATSVEWRDGSLGCPEPGTNYLTVVTPGYLVELEAQGQVYSYHAGQDSPFLCENPQSPLTRSDEELRVLEAAIADLAQRLDIAAGAIEAVKIEPVEWPDASMGCPQPGMSYAQVVTRGYHILLSAGGQEYDYRATPQMAVLCEQ